MTEFIILSECTDVHEIKLVVQHVATGVTLKGKGSDRDETFARVKSEISEIVAALPWPDECNADTINGYEDFEVTCI